MNVLLILIYVAAAIVANLLVYWLGPWASPFIAFALIGLDLTMRDVLHERLRRWQLLVVILVGALITWLINPAAQQIAVASALAFTCAALIDWLVYRLMHRHIWLVRSNVSNMAGAAVDSLVFPTVAFGAFLPAIIVLQFAAKVGGGALWSLVIDRIWRKRWISSA